MAAPLTRDVLYEVLDAMARRCRDHSLNTQAQVWAKVLDAGKEALELIGDEETE